MQAMVRHAYGSPDTLRLEEVDKPSPRPDELLIRVRAAALNLGDWEILTGRPRFITLLARLFGGKPHVRPQRPDGRRSWPEPKYKILGCDVAGRVEAAGGRLLTPRVPACRGSSPAMRCWGFATSAPLPSTPAWPRAAR